MTRDGSRGHQSQEDPRLGSATYKKHRWSCLGSDDGLREETVRGACSLSVVGILALAKLGHCATGTSGTRL